MWAKEKLLFMSNFSFSHNVLKSFLLLCQNKYLWSKGLNTIQAINPWKTNPINNQWFNPSLNDKIITLSKTSPGFYVSAGPSLLKTSWEKEKLLTTSNFSFSHSIFYPFEELSAIFIRLKLSKFVICVKVEIVHVFCEWPKICDSRIVTSFGTRRKHCGISQGARLGLRSIVPRDTPTKNQMDPTTCDRRTSRKWCPALLPKGQVESLRVNQSSALLCSLGVIFYFSPISSLPVSWSWVLLVLLLTVRYCWNLRSCIQWGGLPQKSWKNKVIWKTMLK